MIYGTSWVERFDDFDHVRHTPLICSKWISGDKSICARRPKKTSLGNLPNLSFIIQNMDPLCMGFLSFSTLNLIYFYFIYLSLHWLAIKTRTCPITDVMRHMQIQKGNVGMTNVIYNWEFWATFHCVVHCFTIALLQNKKISNMAFKLIHGCLH